MTTINKYKPCLQYKSPFDKEEGKTVKLKNTTNSKEGKIRLMTGSSAEEVLCTIKAFENKAIDIDLPDNQRIKEFMNCLGSKARDRWAKLVKNRRGGNFASNQWNQAKREWIAECVKDKKAKETILNAWTSTKDFMKPKDLDIEDHADQIETICNYIDLLPRDHLELTDTERKSLLFNTFPVTWCNEFTLNRNDPEQASEKEIKDFMEKRKDKADREDRIKERAQTKAKKMCENKKKREAKKGNEPCRRHQGAHLWKDCPTNPKNRGRGSGRGTYNKNFGRAVYGRGPDLSFNRSQGRDFNGPRNFGGRNSYLARGFGRGRGIQQEQYYQHHPFSKDQSDNSTLETNQSGSYHDWDSHSNEAYHNNQYQNGHDYCPF